jgi:UDP-glucose 4-epimerase
VKVLVAGGAGYIGSVVAAGLIDEGHRVTIFDNMSRGHLEAVPAAANLITGDLEDRAALDRVFAAGSFDAVMHFAALIEAGESMKIPERYFRNNTANTLNLLEVMLAHGVGRLVFSSTAALYGNPVRVPIEEDDALAPTNAYGESKLLVEKILAWFHQCRGLRYASLRYFNAAGAAGERGENHQPESHLIPRVLQVALGQAKEVAIFGTDYPTPDGTCIRDYIHILDLASAHLAALDALASRDRLIYNLGNGQGFSIREVLDVARRVTGHPIPAVETARRPGDPAILVASSARIQRELGWRPQYPGLDTIVSSAWEWHQRHPHGYSPVPA